MKPETIQPSDPIVLYSGQGPDAHRIIPRLRAHDARMKSIDLGPRSRAQNKKRGFLRRLLARLASANS
ncbi:MAG: hypothetical protein ACQKBY_01875 [Verrucomicrobiales bacterium]